MEKKLENVILTTTPSIEGKIIKKYKGIVSARVVTGFGAFRDFFSSITDFFGGRSGSYQKELKKAEEIALAELSQEATSTGANAVIDIKIDYEPISSKRKSLVMVVATGTAVVVE